MDYIRWMGDFPFSSTGFREPDALVLCSLSYFYLTPVFARLGEKARVRDCAALLESGEAKVLLVKEDPGYYDLLRLAAASRRFGELRMSDYVDILRQEPPLQFSALCFHGEDDFSFLAYRGTDSSLAGWREDFMIAFTRTEAQEAALRYAQERLTTRRRWHIGGHSKGGNLALYAAALLPEAAWAQVERVWILDGPGFCPEVLPLSTLTRIDSRTTHIVPRFSVVGKLFTAPITDTRIVQSAATAFLQHGLISWGIAYGKLAEAAENDPVSLWINETVDTWIASVPQQDRATMVTELFDALAAGGAESLAQLEGDGDAAWEAILRKLWEVSATTRRSLSGLPKTALRLSLTGLRERFTAELEKNGLLTS